MPEQILTERQRLLGFLPLLFFLAQGTHYWRIDQLGHMLWMCNIGNLLLAVGLFIDEPVLIRVAAIWTIPGLFIWLRYVVTTWVNYAALDWSAVLASTLAHVGGLTVALIAIARVRINRSAWGFAVIWFFALQLVARMVTPPEFNVNLSRSIYPGWENTFSAYWKFWLVLSLVVVGGCWIITQGLVRLWPPRSNISVW